MSANIASHFDHRQIHHNISRFTSQFSLSKKRYQKRNRRYRPLWTLEKSKREKKNITECGHAENRTRATAIRSCLIRKFHVTSGEGKSHKSRILPLNYASLFRDSFPNTVIQLPSRFHFLIFPNHHNGSTCSTLLHSVL